MFETMYQISLGSRAGILNRVFTVVMISLVIVQLWRMLHFHIRLLRWRYRLHSLEQEAREEGVVTVTDSGALPPSNPYMRFWDMVPSLAIMFGLLGTFIGLTISLSEIPVTGDVDAIQKGLSRSIPSMGTAFWTSLCGLLIALCVRISNAIMASEFRHRVIHLLLASEPQVIEALEASAFQQGRDGALLRPHGIRELIWHQNRLLNQTVARVAPQISEGITRGLGQVRQPSSEGNPDGLLKQFETILRDVKQWQQDQHQKHEQERARLEALVRSHEQFTKSFVSEIKGIHDQLKRSIGEISIQKVSGKEDGKPKHQVTQEMHAVMEHISPDDEK